MSERDNDGTEGLLELMLGNKETRKATMELMQKVKPDLVMPELDIARNTEAAIAAKSKENADKITALEAKLIESETRTRLDNQRRSVVEKGIVSADEIPAVEKLITDMGFPNYETAARYYFAQKQLAPPTPSTYHDKPFKSLGEDFLKNPDAAADKLAHDIVDQYNPNHILRH